MVFLINNDVLRMAKLFCNCSIKKKIFQNTLSAQTICSLLHRKFSDKLVSLEIEKEDVLDTFTSNLIYQRAKKWDRLKINKHCNATYSLAQPKSLEAILSNLSQGDLDKQFLLIVQDRNEKAILEFLKNCKKCLVCPSFNVMVSLLDANAREASIGIVIEIKNIFNSNDKKLYKANASFDHYLAEAYWANGEVVKALHLFEDVYVNNPKLRRQVRLMLRYLMTEVTTYGEAILVSIIRFSEKLYHTYKDHSPLAYVWQSCFVSEWYSDQKLALELLERNQGLCEAVVGNMPSVVSTSLQQHQVEVVYRLLELLIKYEMKTQYAAVLVSIFNYKYCIGDLKSCSEIVQWSVTYDIVLPHVVHERFLMLLLKRRNIDDAKPGKAPQSKIELKF